MKNNKTTCKNISVDTSYGVSGVRISLDLQEVFQLAQKADMLGQHLSWLKETRQIPEYAFIQLQELGNFLENVIISAGFKPRGRADIFCPVNTESEEETE